MSNQEKPTVLVVDDAPENLALMLALLKDKYTVRVANSGKRALDLLQNMSQPPDVILLDIMMPGMDGYEVCEKLKSNPTLHEIPIIFLTALSANADEQHGLEAGAVDYITKPINPAIFLARIRNHIDLSRLRVFLEERNLFLNDRNEWLEAEVRKRTEEVAAMQEAIVYMVSSIVEARDKDTGGHILRTQNFVRELALELRTHPRFADYLTPQKIDLLYKLAPVHDIGKVGTPDHILNKPGPLTPEEWEIMKQHPAIGKHAIDMAEERLGKSFPFFDIAKEIAYGHHERWDGGGYPQGQKGDEIPIPARLMALADVYDVITNRRVYKEPMGHDYALNFIREGSGKHFDPDMVEALFKREQEFLHIGEKYADAKTKE